VGVFHPVSCVGFEQLARRRGIRGVRLYGPLVELGVAADPPPVFSTAQVAVALGVSRERVRALVLV
jgi:hypothetical protein